MAITSTTAATLGVLGVLAIGGGTVAVAQQSQPGDLLYPLSITVDGEAGAGAEADLEALQETYDEAAALDAQGGLTADVRADLEGRYNVHLNNVLEAIAALEAEGDMEGAAELRTELRSSLREVGSYFDADVSVEASSEASAASSASSGASSSTDGSVDVKVDANASAGVSVSAENGEDVHRESRDSESEHYESDDGSVRIDANAEATSTVHIDQD